MAKFANRGGIEFDNFDPKDPEVIKRVECGELTRVCEDCEVVAPKKAEALPDEEPKPVEKAVVPKQFDVKSPEEKLISIEEQLEELKKEAKVLGMKGYGNTKEPDTLRAKIKEFKERK